MVKKFLKKHPSLQKKYIEIAKELSFDPYYNSVDFTGLVGVKNHYRFRIGKYRFLYEIREKEVLIYVYDADSRGSIYKK